MVTSDGSVQVTGPSNRFHRLARSSDLTRRIHWGNVVARMGILFAALLGLLATLLTPSAASAANSDGNCETYEVCIYKHANLDGSFSDYRYYDSDYYQNTFDWQESTCGICWQNDQVSSVDNWDARYKVRFFVDKNYDGSRQTIAEYGRDTQVTYNDAYSSHCWNDDAQAGVDADCNF